MDKLSLEQYLPFWQALSPAQQARLENAVSHQSVARGTVMHRGDMVCTGLILVLTGQLRAYALSPEGREITLYRLFERDMCLFSAPCILRGIQFDVTVAAEQDCSLLTIAPDAYKAVMAESATVANYTNELMEERFSEVMWLLEQILWKSVDKRLAQLLLEEATLAESDTVHTTHEGLANHLGTAREVVTRMLRYFQREGWVCVKRGSITITNQTALETLRAST